MGAGVTLRALFAEWPRERLAQIYSEARTPDGSAASAFFRLNEGEAAIHSVLLRQLVRAVLFVVGRGETGMFFFARITARLEQWLCQAAPDVVFTQLGGLPMALLSLEIARRRRIPFILHVSDDWVQGWPSNVLGRSLFPVTHLADRAMKRVFRRAMRDAAAVTVISEEMAVEYESRYGRRSRVLHNGIDLSEWPDGAPHGPGSPARVLYSGSVFAYAQSSSLEDARDAVVHLRAHGHPIELVIRTQHATADPQRRAFGAVPGIVLRDLGPRAQLPHDLSAADVLLLPVNFDPVTIGFIRLSIPGKLAEYLASGTPVLYYGPPDVAQARFLAGHGCALLVTSRDAEQLRSALIRMLTDLDLRRELSARARHAAELHFDVRSLRRRLYEVIDETLPARRAPA